LEELAGGDLPDLQQGIDQGHDGVAGRAERGREVLQDDQELVGAAITGEDPPEGGHQVAERPRQVEELVAEFRDEGFPEILYQPVETVGEEGLLDAELDGLQLRLQLRHLLHEGAG